MYGIALSVAACLRGGTRVDVAWNLDADLTPRFDPSDAIGLTPGGGKLGALLGGALDSRLAELVAAKPTTGRIVTVDLDELEADTIGVAPGTSIRVMLAPADNLPEGVWDHLLDRRPVALGLELDGDRVAAFRLDERTDRPRTEIGADAGTVGWSPRPTLVVMGGGPLADAVARAGEFVGWAVETTPGPEPAIGHAAMLSPIDGIIVLGHDTEGVGRVLQAAIGSNVGYIGSIGPTHLQQARADWLAYRGITDIARISGPAGLDIGADSPEEIAISVVAEMISATRTTAD